jgi:serine/threonine-protein kinase HipA
MDRAGVWRLSPAFDITWSYNPDGQWTDRHQMSMNGKRDHFTPEDFDACAAAASLSQSRTRAIVRDVRAVVARWPDFADAAGIGDEWRRSINRTARLILSGDPKYPGVTQPS